MQNQRADQRAEHGSHAADNGHKQHLDRQMHAVGDRRVEIEIFLGIESSGRTAHGAHDHDRLAFAAKRVYAKCFCRILILANGDQLRAKARILQPDRDGDRNRHQDQREIIETDRRLELQVLQPWRIGQEQPDTAAGDLERIGDHPQQFGKSQCDQREIGPAKAGTETEIADTQRKHCAGKDRDHNTDDRRNAE